LLHLTDRTAMDAAFEHVLRRTEHRRDAGLRAWHDRLVVHRAEILALADVRPAVGRTAARNNTWATEVRTGRGYEDLARLQARLAFRAANPVRRAAPPRRLKALGVPAPLKAAS
jgi:hypothetical protein